MLKSLKWMCQVRHNTTTVDIRDGASYMYAIHTYVYIRNLFIERYIYTALQAQEIYNNCLYDDGDILA